MKDLPVVDISSLKFAKDSGLIPVITQDADSREVLMAAFANKKAIEKTLATGYAHYWSRSRRRLWKKGETSGNTQKIMGVLVDCDQDALLYFVKQKGDACHTGKRTCFHYKLRNIANCVRHR